MDFSRLESNKVRGRTAIEVPDDALLFKTREEVSCANIVADAGWRWVYSILLLAGLRPHEAFFCEWSDAGLEVLQGKTGPRTIFYEAFELLYPSEKDGCKSLVDEWGLKNIRLPNVNAQSAYEKGSLGGKVCIRWARWQLPFSPYTICQAFALRTSVTRQRMTACSAPHLPSSTSPSTKPLSAQNAKDAAFQNLLNPKR